MTQSSYPVEHRVASQSELETDHPSKRVKYESHPVRLDGAKDKSLAVPSHPLGVRPSGNAYTSTRNIKSNAGWFAILPDETLLQMLEYLEAPELLRLGATCKAIHAFSRAEELWKALLIESSPTSLTWQGTWRSTLLGRSATREPEISCLGLFSDTIHRPFHCAHIPLDPFISNIPARNEIKRFDDLSREEFAESYTGEPFILTEPVKSWPIYRNWSTEALLRKYGHVVFRAEAVDWPLKTYADYMENSKDESPLYLFDSRFVEKMGIEVGKDTPDSSYWIPDCFGEDLFAVLGKQRPDCRWLIVGPERSGSTFHKDPNGTSAWNAVLRGSKYWIMFPSSSSLPPPPGVFVSSDQSEVTSPLSIAEWLLGFHAEARATPGCIEGICSTGEVLHVPSGYYHLVVNLEPSIAITQNFVPESKLREVLEFLRTKPDQISGFPKDVVDPFILFSQKLEEQFPGLLEVSANKKSSKGIKKTSWQAAVKKQDEDDAVFSFGFESEDEAG
ncbi:Clavaminate synthase-like protein [Viridothelium virens]|uniref:Clavaminate synthase-like protein n=1 Tax=Viridothelium virens TaxID=1048519 RepID=A0A6A6H964_VIRVR|nr:Clavaminate synthase-like protein [Viridothelium virens]